MAFYPYRPDSNNFAGIAFPLDDEDRIVKVHYADMALQDKWIAPVAHAFEDNPEKEGEFPSLSNFWRIPVMSQRAWYVLHPLMGDCCEALPIVHPTGKPYFIIHVMDTVDALDLAKSEFTRNATTGRKAQHSIERRHRRQRVDLMVYEKQRQEILKDLGADPYVD